MKSIILLAAAVTSIAAQPAPPTVTLYSQNFDGLRLGKTTNPATPGQDQWFAELAVGEAYGEIQNAIANSGKALHEFTALSNVNAQQTELTVVPFPVWSRFQDLERSRSQSTFSPAIATMQKLTPIPLASI